MLKSYDTIEEAVTIELIEKKSRFIGNIFPVCDEEEVRSILASLKSKYKDAGHHCYGYIIGNKEGFSDDGEPSGTAGKPILATLRGSGLNNVLIVVTRYFGGTLLGTGGLVRAYSESTKTAIEHAKRITLIYGYKVMIQIDYSYLKKLQYLLEQKNIRQLESTFTEVVNITVEISEDKLSILEDLVIELTAGKGIVKNLENIWISNR
jgi:uncharacterized YigZ family protein